MRYLIGSYNEEPTIYELQINDNNCKEYQIKTHSVNSIPSYMIKDDKYIYVANKDGGISIYNYNIELIAEWIDEHSYTHLCLKDNEIVAVSYRDGISALFCYEDGELYKINEINHQGTYLDPHHRQDCPHPHFVLANNDIYLSCDLGRNGITTLQLINDELCEINIHIFKDICGPRHMLFTSDNNLLLVNEVNNTLYLLSYPSLEIIDEIAIGEDPTKQEKLTHSLSAIHYHNKRNSYFISDRVHEDISQVVEVIIENSRLSIINNIPCGKHPREILLNEDILIVGCLLDNKIEIFNINKNKLIETINIPYPVCFLKL